IDKAFRFRYHLEVQDHVLSEMQVANHLAEHLLLVAYSKEDKFRIRDFPDDLGQGEDERIGPFHPREPSDKEDHWRGTDTDPFAEHFYLTSGDLRRIVLFRIHSVVDHPDLRLGVPETYQLVPHRIGDRHDPVCGHSRDPLNVLDRIRPGGVPALLCGMEMEDQWRVEVPLADD